MVLLFQSLQADPPLFSNSRINTDQDVQENEEGSRSDSTDSSNTICDSIDSLDEPLVPKRRRHVFMELWKASRPWLQVDSKNKMYCLFLVCND